MGAGQQSRIHCTRLAGNKADIWHLRQHPKVLALPFKADIRRPDRDNTIDVYISDDDMDVLADGVWEQFFTVKPEPLTRDVYKRQVKDMKRKRTRFRRTSRAVSLTAAVLVIGLAAVGLAAILSGGSWWPHLRQALTCLLYTSRCV